MFEPEYANVYGIPFAFIPSDRVTKDPLPRPPAIQVESLIGREHLRIEFPHLNGYRVEVPDERLIFSLDAADRFVIGPSTVPRRTDIEGIIGAGEKITADGSAFRTQRVAYELANRLVRNYLRAGDDPRPWLFPQVVAICREWLTNCVDVADGFSIGQLLLSSEWQAEAAESILNAIVWAAGDRRERLRPILRPLDSVGSTADVSFATRKAVEATEKSELSHVTLDGIGGNTWEQLLAGACERDGRVAAYVKNDHVGFVIPYVHQGRTHSYLPDFLVRLVQRRGDESRTLIVEVSGGQKSPGPTKAKADTARNQWCVAVNNHGGLGGWGYVEIRSMAGVRDQLAEAIELLYADAAIIGDPELLDFAEFERGGRAAS